MCPCGLFKEVCLLSSSCFSFCSYNIHGFTGYYPQLIALYEHLGVQFREADFSYSFSTLFQPPPVKRRSSSETQTRRITSTMIYNGKSGREGVGIPSSFFPPLDTTSQSSLIPFLGFVVSRIQAYTLFAVSTILLLGFYLALVFHSLPLHVNIPRTVTVRSVSGASIHLPFPKDIFSFIPRRPPRHTTLREWTELTTPKGYLARRFGLDQRWREFVSGVMVLLFSAVCTASEEMIWDMPVEEVLGVSGIYSCPVLCVCRGILIKLCRKTSAVLQIIYTSPLGHIITSFKMECARLRGN